MGRHQIELDEAVRTIGTNVMGVQGDVSTLADIDRLYETVRAEDRRIDVVFASAAGLGEFAALGCITEEFFDRRFNTNVKGALFTVQKALPLLNDGAPLFSRALLQVSKGRLLFGFTAQPRPGNCEDGVHRPMGRMGSAEEIARAARARPGAG
jgi:NAD(P)-dependent dehydrogenase (short-subunit alcohol dehydrogenase family)